MEKNKQRPVILVFDPFPSLYPYRLAETLSKIYYMDVVVVCNLSIHRAIYKTFLSLKVIDENQMQTLIPSVALCIVYNDLRPQWLKNKRLFENVRTVFLERGLLRGKYCQASFCGVNSRSALGISMIGEFTDWNVTSKKQRNTIKYSFFERKYGYKIFVFLLIFSGFLEIKLRQILRIKHNFPHGLNIWKYVNRIVKTPKYIELIQNEKFPTVLVALQLEEDTQFKDQFLFRSNKDFICFLLSSIRNKKINLVIKQHPNDGKKIETYINKSENGINIISDSQREFNYVVSLNSTYTLEALISGKKVYTFGASSYLYLDDESDYKFDFKNWLKKIELGYEVQLGSGSAKIVGQRFSISQNELLKWLLSNSLPGDLIGYNESQVELAAEILINNCDLFNCTSDKLRDF